MNILVFGKTGQIASNFFEIHKNYNKFNFYFATRDEADFSKPSAIFEYLNNLKFKPDYIINAVAYTAVDKAEDEKDLCDNINVKSVKIIAEFSKKNNVILIHYSTDYVFDGAGQEPFLESNFENLKPLNYYGLSKLKSEQEIINSRCKYFIFRISWVYNHSGKNFPLTILRLAIEREELKIVSDQFGSPCYAKDIAVAGLKLIDDLSKQNDDSENIFGVYHLTPQEYISWYDFTNLIIEQAKINKLSLKVKNILPIKSEEFLLPAKRPKNSRLNSDKAKNKLGLELPKIKTSLEEFFSKVF